MSKATSSSTRAKKFQPLFTAFRYSLVLLTMLASVPRVMAAESGQPIEIVRSTIDQVVKIAVEFKGDAALETRRAKLREVINPVFDFSEMAKQSLGANWRGLTADEQTEFVRVFSDLLAKTYLSKIETVEPGMVTIDSQNVEAPRAVVKTTVRSKGDAFPINYKMYTTKEGAWRVYDVVVENIGLVVNYRNEFAGVIRRDKVSGLIEQLKKKGEAR